RGVREGGWVDGGDARRASLGALRALRCGDGARPLYPEPTLKGRAIMSDAIAVSGTVSQSMPNAIYRVHLDNGHKVLAPVAGALRMRYPRIAPGDKVPVQLAPLALAPPRLPPPPGR